MNKIIKEQLDNVLNVKINYSDSDTTIVIPKLKSIQSNNLVLNNIYLVLFDKNVQDKESSLCSNWNRGRVPSQLKYKCEVLQKMGKVYQLNGIGVSDDGQDLPDVYWYGWVPADMITVIEKIS